MGVDFIRAKAARFRKAADAARIRLGTADLFTREPECAERTALADLIAGEFASVGDHLLIMFQSDRLVALRCNVIVATFSCPPSDLLDAVARSAGVASGVVAELHELSRTISVRTS